MDNTVFESYVVEDRSYISFIKREIHSKLVKAGFNETRTGQIDIVVSELASNLIKHAGSGEFIYRITEDEPAFEIYCLDNGPGTDQIARMLKDGMSSTNTLGHGLGTINRFSNVFQIYSMQNWGTVVYSKCTPAPPSEAYTRTNSEIFIKPLQLCYPGEKVCGDGYQMKVEGPYTHIFLGDGLGHGAHAEEAVNEAIKAFMECRATDPTETLRFIHSKVKKTRGLVASIAVHNAEDRSWAICGVGNITIKLYQGLASKNYMAHNGIIGLNIPTSLSSYYTKAGEDYNYIIMYSDGLKSRVELSRFTSILRYDPSIIAAALFKEYARRTDDMTILVGKINF